MQLSLAFLTWVALASALAFVLMAIDKARSRRAGWRVRERDLLIAALIGGSPGTLVAMLLLRHKTRKTRFVVPFVIIGTAQVGVAWVLLR